MFGYMGKILRINLTTGEIGTEDLDFELAKKFIGGRGLGTKLYMDEVDPKVDPFAAENKIVFINKTFFFYHDMMDIFNPVAIINIRTVFKFKLMNNEKI